MIDPLVVAGLDVDAGRWAVIVLRDLEVVDGFLAPAIGPALDRARDARAFGIDIPIGLPERDERRSDVLARALAGSSVFMTPPREVVEAVTWADARERHRSLRGIGLSRQAWNLGAKIREVDAFLREQPDTPAFEVHPELSFRSMNGGRRLEATKHSWSGHVERLRLLEREGISIPDAMPDLRRAGIADVLDAAAAAWSARRIALGSNESLPPGERGPGVIHY